MRKLILTTVTFGLLGLSTSAWAGFFPTPHPHGPPAHHAVPELDASVASAAFALIAGGAAVVHGRRRKSRR